MLFVKEMLSFQVESCHVLLRFEKVLQVSNECLLSFLVLEVLVWMVEWWNRALPSEIRGQSLVNHEVELFHVSDA